jgi:hypothetical protein
MKADGMAVASICKYTGLSEDEVARFSVLLGKSCTQQPVQD